MTSARSAVLLAAGLCLLIPTAGRGQKLDDDGKRFLRDVQPIMLPDERAVFEGLEDEANRATFQEIFWARRDPNPTTVENQFRQQYEEARAIADRRYSVPGRRGSTTDCGRLFILVGKPDEIERDPRSWTSRAFDATLPGSGQISHPSRTAVTRDGEIIRQPIGLVRWPQVWVYKDRPDRRLQPGRVEIVFDEECSGGGGFAQELDRVAATKILHPGIDYEVEESGRLTRPVNQRPGDSSPRR